MSKETFLLFSILIRWVLQMSPKFPTFLQKNEGCYFINNFFFVLLLKISEYTSRDSLVSMTENHTPAQDFSSPVAASTHVGGCPPVLHNGNEAESEEVHPLDQIHWFVMRSSYCREMKALELLQADDFKCYVPTHQQRVERNGQITQRTMPIVHNLVFVQTCRRALDPWKRLHEADAGLRYTIDKSTQRPMIVSEKAMEDFMRVTSESDDSLLYLDNPEIILTKGQKVEVVLGPFKGIQGYVLRIRKDRRVVVTLGGLVSVALATMPQSHFKLISEH